MFFDGSVKNQTDVNSDGSSARPKEDRRYLPRWNVANRILYRKDNETLGHECQSKDIHDAGICIHCGEDIQANDKLSLIIYLSKSSTPIEAYGRVVWNKKNDKDTLAGIRFERLTSEAREMIFNYAFESQRDKIVNNWFKGW